MAAEFEALQQQLAQLQVPGEKKLNLKERLLDAIPLVLQSIANQKSAEAFPNQPAPFGTNFQRGLVGNKQRVDSLAFKNQLDLLKAQLSAASERIGQKRRGSESEARVGASQAAGRAAEARVGASRASAEKTRLDIEQKKELFPIEKKTAILKNKKANIEFDKMDRKFNLIGDMISSDDDEISARGVAAAINGIVTPELTGEQKTRRRFPVQIARLDAAIKREGGITDEELGELELLTKVANDPFLDFLQEPIIGISEEITRLWAKNGKKGERKDFKLIEFVIGIKLIGGIEFVDFSVELIIPYWESIQKSPELMEIYRNEILLDIAQVSGINPEAIELQIQSSWLRRKDEVDKQLGTFGPESSVGTFGPEIQRETKSFQSPFFRSGIPEGPFQPGQIK